MSLQNSIGYFYLFHIRKVNRKLLKCISCRYDYELQANHYGNQIKWQNYLQLRLFIHTTRHFGRPWKLSHLFLRWSKTIFLHSRICFSCEKWKLHEVLHLIVSTASELRVRIRIDHSSDSGYLLFFDIFESVRLYHRDTGRFWRHSSHRRQFHLIWIGIIENFYLVVPATVMADWYLPKLWTLMYY